MTRTAIYTENLICAFALKERLDLNGNTITKSHECSRSSF